MHAVKTYFMVPLIFSFCALVASFGYGYSLNGIAMVFDCLTTTCILGALELALSFDNAIVNASKLNEMNDIWKKRFLTWGMLIAVFGMRVVFPTLIVSIFGHVSPWAAIQMSLFHADDYARTLEHADPMISAFGGNFLLMVALSFFFETSGAKDAHWITPVEKAMSAIGERANALGVVAVVLGIDVIIAYHVGSDKGFRFFMASIAGIITYVLVSILSGHAGASEHKTAGPTLVASGGFGTFMYLEIQDASFSFDGVIGAFAMSHLLVIIALGLGIGAAFVRGMTIMLAETNSLSKYVYLKNGAFWAILIMALFMEFKPYGEVPDLVVGGISIALLSASFFSSKKHQSK